MNAIRVVVNLLIWICLILAVGSLFLTIFQPDLKLAANYGMRTLIFVAGCFLFLCFRFFLKKSGN